MWSDFSKVIPDVHLTVQYAEEIALEYSHVPTAQFCSRRGAVLQGMVTQPSVYFTPELKAAYEAQARENVALEGRLLAAVGAAMLPYGDAT